MRSTERRDESPKSRINRSSHVSPSITVTLSMLVAAGQMNIQNVFEEHEPRDSQTVLTVEQSPEDIAHLQQINVDLDAALEHCTSCENLIGIGQVLATLFPRSTPVSIEELREASKNQITEALYIPVERSLTILESNPHLAWQALDLTEKKLAKLPPTALHKVPLELVLDACKKQIADQWNHQRQLAQRF